MKTFSALYLQHRPAISNPNFKTWRYESPRNLTAPCPICGAQPIIHGSVACWSMQCPNDEDHRKNGAGHFGQVEQWLAKCRRKWNHVAFATLMHRNWLRDERRICKEDPDKWASKEGQKLAFTRLLRYRVTWEFHSRNLEEDLRQPFHEFLMGDEAVYEAGESLLCLLRATEHPSKSRNQPSVASILKQSDLLNP